jgi:hypothetical protein
MNALLAFPARNLPSTTNHVVTQPDQGLLDSLRIDNPSLSNEVFNRHNALMGCEDVTSLFQLMIDADTVGIPLAEQMQNALEDYVTCTLSGRLESVKGSRRREAESLLRRICPPQLPMKR